MFNTPCEEIDLRRADFVMANKAMTPTVDDGGAELWGHFKGVKNMSFDEVHISPNTKGKSNFDRITGSPAPPASTSGLNRVDPTGEITFKSEGPYVPIPA